MRKVYAGFTAVLLLAIVAQFYLAAVGAFDTAPKDDSFEMHRMLGYLILLLALLTTVVAALARVPGRLIAQTALVVGMAVMQGLIRMFAGAIDAGDTSTTAGRFVFGLHALNGLGMFGVTEAVLARAWRLAAADGAASQATRAGEAGAPVSDVPGTS